MRVVQDGVDGNAYLLPDGRWALTPEGDFNGVVTFTYTITDGRLGTTTQNSISVDFSPVNDAPVARSDSGYRRRKIRRSRSIWPTCSPTTPTLNTTN